MKTTKEIWGLRCEIAGLVVILIATVWQGAFTDWFDKYSHESQYFIQENVNLTILRTLNDLSSQLTTTEQNKRQIQEQVSQRVERAYSEAISQRDRRQELQRSQASLFSTVRYLVLIIGAALLIVGKWLGLVAVTSAECS